MCTLVYWSLPCSYHRTWWFCILYLRLSRRSNIPTDYMRCPRRNRLSDSSFVRYVLYKGHINTRLQLTAAILLRTCILGAASFSCERLSVSIISHRLDYNRCLVVRRCCNLPLYVAVHAWPGSSIESWLHTEYVGKFPRIYCVEYVAFPGKPTSGF